MFSIVNCSLPETGAGLSVTAVAMVVLLAGVVLWRVPRAHRMHMLLAIALPLAALAMGSRSASAAADECVTTTTEAAARQTTTTVPATTTTVAPTTTVPALFTATITYENGENDPVFTSAGWTSASTTSPNAWTKVYTGTVSRTNPTISIAITALSTETTFQRGTLTGATCTDGASTPLDNSGSGYQTVVSPVTCTLTGNFTITFYGQAV